MKNFLQNLSVLAALLLVVSIFSVTSSPPEITLGTFNPSGGGTYRLYSSIGTTDTSIRLSSFKEPVSNTLYTMSYMNTDLACATIDPQTSRSEFVSFTGITQNNDGTATLTGVSRGLGRSYPYTASTTLAQAHPGQSAFILSDSPCLFTKYAIKENDEGITGSWTFPEPTADANPTTKSYVDNLVNGGDVSINRVAVAGTAGEAFATGTILYFEKSDARWYKADTDVTGSVQYPLIGIAQGAGVLGNSISGGVLLHGLDSTQIALTAGANYFVSATAGATTTATTTVGIGKAWSTTQLYVDTHFYGPSLTAVNTWVGTQTFTGDITLSGAISNIASTTVYATTTTGVWTKPSNLKFLIVEAVGGGGGGGGSTTDSRGAGGGGGGGYCKKVIPASLVGATETVTVGAGGTAGAASGGTGGTGGTSSFGSHCSATGGVGGTDGSGGVGGDGGAGSSGDFNSEGGDGGGGAADPSGGTFAISGMGGSSVYGGGGRSVFVPNGGDAAGVAGNIYGGGGSGAALGTGGDTAGGAGAQGVVIITSVFY